MSTKRKNHVSICLHARHLHTHVQHIHKFHWSHKRMCISKYTCIICNKSSCRCCSFPSPSRTLYLLVFFPQTQVPKCIVVDSLSFCVSCWLKYIHRQFEYHCCVEYDTAPGGLDPRRTYLLHGRTERKITLCNCHGHSLCIQGLFLLWPLLFCQIYTSMYMSFKTHDCTTCE